MNRSKTEYPYIGQGALTSAKYLITGVDKYNKDILKGYVLSSGLYVDNLYKPKIVDITEEYLADKKIKILSPLHSEYVQKLAFNYGYGWEYGHQNEVLYTDAPCLFFYKVDKDICHSDGFYDFNNYGFQEITIHLPEDYVSEEDVSVEKESDVEEFKVGDEILYDGTSFPEIKGEKVKVIGICNSSKDNQVLTVEHIDQGVIAIINGSWFSKPKTEEDLLLESLEFDIQSSKDSGDTSYGTAVKLMENYSITKKPQ